MITMAKKIVQVVAGDTAMKFRQKLTKDQEVPGKPADIIIELFAMESGLLRTIKMIDKEREEKAEYRVNAVHLSRNGADRIIDLEVYPF
jgi:uncharacterized protein YaaN involved in tellurite resistance